MAIAAGGALVVVLSHYPPVEGHSMAAYRQLLTRGLAERGWRVRCRTAPVWLGRLAGAGGPSSHPSEARALGEQARRGGAALAKWLGYGDQFLIFPLLLALEQWRWPRKTCVLVSDQALGPWVPLICHRPHLIICHDLLALQASRGAFWQQPVGRSGRLYQRFIRWGFRWGRRFAAVSQASAAELAGELAPARPPISVLPNPLPPGFGPLPPDSALERLRQLEPELVEAGELRPYLLHVGGYWYKNREGVCAVFGALRRRRAWPGASRLRLVLVGHLEGPARDWLEAHPDDAAACLLLPGVTTEQLRALYSAAAALLFPSWREGFGWPVLEALACGCPVLATKRPPLTEVGGEAVSYLPPCPDGEGPREAWCQQAAASVEAVLRRPDAERQAWRERGLRQAARFSRQSWLDQLEQALACAASQA